MVASDRSNRSNANGRSSKSKVARLIHEYGLGGLETELEEYWTRDDDERLSLRELADYFNEALLAAALDGTGQYALDGETSNLYRLLTDDDVSSGTRVSAENRLERIGVDVQQLRADFVSRQAIHTYLTKEREVTYDRPDPSDEKRVEARIDTIRRLRSRLVAVVERALAELTQADLLPERERQVTVLVQIHCTHCDSQHPVTEFLTDGCQCSS